MKEPEWKTKWRKHLSRKMKKWWKKYKREKKIRGRYNTLQNKIINKYPDTLQPIVGRLGR